MNEENKSILSPTIEGERNEILRRYGNHSFSAALKEVNDTLSIEKDYETRLGLLAAKSWILRKKLYVTLHDPYISALSEIEDENIFDGFDDDEYNEFDSLFDEETTEKKEKMVEILVLKKTTINEKSVAKDTILEVDEKLSKTLIEQGKAKINDNKK
tara:strand:+ start:539 stop:1009 length:471 start_codon:yes stop_codon:yes gene_type:complete